MVEAKLHIKYAHRTPCILNGYCCCIILDAEKCALPENDSEWLMFWPQALFKNSLSVSFFGFCDDEAQEG